MSIGRQKAVYGRRRIQEEPIPGTCLECATSKALASALAPYFARPSSATLRNNAQSAFRRQHCHSALITCVAERSAHGVNHAAHDRRAGAPISSAKPTIRTTSFESSSRTIARRSMCNQCTRPSSWTTQKSIDECLGQSVRKGCIARLPKARRSSGWMHCKSK